MTVLLFKEKDNQKQKSAFQRQDCSLPHSFCVPKPRSQGGVPTFPMNPKCQALPHTTSCFLYSPPSPVLLSPTHLESQVRAGVDGIGEGPGSDPPAG